MTTQILRSQDYSEIFQQVERDGLWNGPRHTPYYGSLAWAIAAAPVDLRPPCLFSKSTYSRPDELRLSDHFFEHDVVAEVVNRLRSFHASNCNRRFPSNSRVGEIVVDP
ncbi:hypothetical protein IV102_31690 [bacterium]|nr:hypothetical protein [bacterium]